MFDICVIGAGPGGFAAAVRAWDHGLRVALVERGPLGGAGVHAGALSSKTFWELSRDYRKALHVDRGYRAESVALDFAAVVGEVDAATREKTEQLADQLRELAELDGDHGGRIELVRGSAAFVDAHTVRVTRDDAPVRELRASHFVIATGSRPRELGTVRIDGRRVMTSDHVGQLDDFPESLVIVGAGVTGCEFATVFANYGRTRVFLVDRAPRILPYEDADVALVCQRNLQSRGVTVHHGASLGELRVRDEDGRVEYGLRFAEGRTERHTVERALLSVGRVPNTDGLGLEGIGVELDDGGYVVVGEDTRSSLPHVHAVGDVTRDIALVNIAEMEALHAVDRIRRELRGGEPAPDLALNYDAVSTIMFLDPEVAAVGLNELQAQARRLPYRVAVYGYRLVNRAIAMRATGGFVKILVSDDDEMRLLGMRALGVHASTMIEGVALAIQQGLGARAIASLVHPHPSVTEAVAECCRMLLGSSLKKPRVFTRDLRLARVGYDDAGQPRVSDLCRSSAAQLCRA